MFILDATTKTLEIILAGAVTANQLPFTTGYADVTTSTQSVTPGAQDGQSNNTTAVTIMAAPASGAERRLVAFSLTNADTSVATVTIRLNDNATIRNMYKASLSVGDNLVISQQKVTVYDLNGNVKTVQSSLALPLLASNGGTGLATLTAHAVMLGEGTGSVGFATIGTAGRLLIDQGAGADPTFNAMSGDGTISNSGALAVTKSSWSALQTYSAGLYISGGAAEEAVYANGNSGTSLAVNLNNGNLQSVTITGAVAITQGTPTHPGKYTLIVTQDGTGHIYSLSGIKWVGGTAPTYSTAASKVDVFSIVYDGTNYYGMAGIAFA